MFLRLSCLTFLLLFLPAPALAQNAIYLENQLAGLEASLRELGQQISELNIRLEEVRDSLSRRPPPVPQPNRR